ncbi:metal-sulfur cluster assembly factor, partial [Staphylococcus sp. EG-SA-26]|uniref:metal-sulfur cluster assembly factor n=1 Tax=Staphylococcus sp. EG-SA-26 TaxID=2767498 RepID=UPI001F11EDF9
RKTNEQFEESYDKLILSPGASANSLGFESDITFTLRNLEDTELGIDIVNLGLVYKVNVDDEGVCTVDMTLTSMGCPMGPQII